MEWLNYHHLLYFWTVAREGSITRASAQLRLAQPTISGQIRELEESLGEKLFTRSGRNLVLTDMGRVVLGYADAIFGMGRELMDTLKGRPTGHPVRLVVGVADMLPKMITYHLLAPALHLKQGVRIVCREDRQERLLAELALHELDVILSDAPIGPGVKLRAFSHLMGECGVSFLCTPKLAAAYRRNFPRSLNGAPFLFPAEGTMLRRSLEQWFDAQGIRPQVVAEIQDSALLKAFGQAGAGIFATPSVIEAEVKRQHGVRLLGRTDKVRERYYAISAERRLRHPAVVAIFEAARRKLFA